MRLPLLLGLALATLCACPLTAPSSDGEGWPCAVSRDCSEGFYCETSLGVCLRGDDPRGVVDGGSQRIGDAGPLPADGGTAPEGGPAPDGGPGDGGAPLLDSGPVPHDAGRDAGPEPEDAGADPADAGPLDADGDGVSDVLDNCPAADNADQHDEDGDGVGDACDNCPAVHNPLQENVLEVVHGADADQVGDACDPRPDSGGDALLFFDGFEREELGDGWQPVAGTWTLQGGDLVQPSTSSNGSAGWRLLHGGLDHGDMRVEAEITITGAQSTNFAKNAGIGVRITPELDGYLCTARAPSSGRGVAYFEMSGGNWDYVGGYNSGAFFSVGTPFLLSGEMVGTSLRCELDGVGVSANDSSVASGGVLLLANRFSMRVAWIAVYGLGP